MSRLLILSCSQRKRSDPGLMPAIERYDGPAFRILRKYRREQRGRVPQTFVLSAKYGLISGEHPISEYDQRMTMPIAQEMRSRVRAYLATCVEDEKFEDAFICAGQTYLEAIGDMEAALFDFPVQVARGSIGGQMATLYDWLRGEAPDPIPVEALEWPVVFRGVEIRRSEKRILELAQGKALKDSAGAKSYQAWYVQAGEQRVAPKWLVSVLTDIPVKAFNTGDARRVLARLGIEVCRA